jgi:PTS system galactitol-specific IIC component
MAPFAVLTETAVEHIKPLREIDLTADTLQEKIGVFAEPSIEGFVIGTIIGLLAGFRVPESLVCGVKMGAFMLLIPRVVKCIMDGLIPIQERVRELAVRKFKGKSVFIGMDPAILLGDSTVMTAGILLVPITILLAVITPGNRILPLGDLATISFFIAIAAGIHRGNLFRTLLSGTMIMYITLWIANRTGPWVTALLSAGGMLESGQVAACLDQGGCPVTYLYTSLLSGEGGIGIILIGALYLAGLALAYRSWKRNTKELP